MNDYDEQNHYALNAMKCGIPDYMIGGLVRWIELGIHPGSFLYAVLSNDLKRACEQADDVNRHHLWHYVNFLYNYAPVKCWGSSDRASTWNGLPKELHKEATT